MTKLVDIITRIVVFLYAFDWKLLVPNSFENLVYDLYIFKSDIFIFIKISSIILYVIIIITETCKDIKNILCDAKKTKEEFDCGCDLQL